MANQKKGDQKKTALIDPIYQKFTKSILRALGSTEFYEFFMDSVAHANNQIQFSNRKAIKTVDLTWVDAIEESLQAFQSIISSPRNMIYEEELIVNVANAKKAGSDVVRHLAQHASLVEDFDEKRGNVRPSRLMQKYREDSEGLYENRLVFTALENAYTFVKIRHDALFSAMSDEFGAKLKVDSSMDTATEQVHLEMFMHIKEIDGALETDAKNEDIFARISRIYRVLHTYMNTAFAQQMAKLARVRGSITKTNILKKNPNYRKIMQLFEFLNSYTDIGYTIRIVEQNPSVNEQMQRDIFHNIMFNYLILKGYLEDEGDRQIPGAAKTRKRNLKPKFIREIIEELTEDYDLPDVEIRKVLIEELTKEQLMQEEAAERRRLVEEQAQRKKEEQERLRKEKEAEKERLRKEREAEKERLRLEKEEQEAAERQRRMEQEAEDRRRCKLLRTELDYFQEQLEARLKEREEEAARKAAELQAFEEMLRQQEEEERRKEEHKQYLIRQALEAKERQLREAEERKKQEEAEKQRLEEERLARLAEELRLKQEEEERKLQQQREEEERRAMLLQQKQEAEELARRLQDELDTKGTLVYHLEITAFLESLAQRMAYRLEYEERVRQEKEEWELDRQRRRAARIPLIKR